MSSVADTVTGYEQTAASKVLGETPNASCTKKHNDLLIVVLVPCGVAFLLGIIFACFPGLLRVIGVILILASIIAAAVALPVMWPRVCTSSSSTPAAGPAA